VKTKAGFLLKGCGTFHKVPKELLLFFNVFSSQPKLAKNDGKSIGPPILKLCRVLEVVVVKQLPKKASFIKEKKLYDTVE